MKNVIRIYVFKLFLISNVLLGQNSFSVTFVESFDLPSPYFLVLSPPLVRIDQVDQEQGVHLCFFDDDKFEVILLSEEGEVEYSYKIVPAPAEYAPILFGYQVKSGQSLIASVLQDSQTDSSFSALYVLNFEENIFWSRKISAIAFHRWSADFVTDSTILVQHNMGDSFLGSLEDFKGPDSLRLALLSANAGELVWSNLYIPDSSVSLLNYGTSPSVPVFLDGSMSVLGGEAISSNWMQNFFLLRIDMMGNVMNSVFISDTTWQVSTHVISNTNDVYLVGRIPYFYLENGNTGYDGFVAKLNADYELLWVRRFHADEYSCRTFNVSLNQNGELLFAYVSYGEFPVIIGSLSDEGQLLYQKGYAFYNPQIAVNEEGGAVFTSGLKYAVDGSYSLGLVVAQTDTYGSIESCLPFETCLEIYDDLSFSLDSCFWEIVTASDLTSLPLEVSSIDLNTEPYCSRPPFPSSYFTVLDTFCQNTCWSPDSLQNTFANAVRWEISGPGIDTTFSDLDFEWCFDIPGTYYITQTVWTLGCSDSYAREVVVLPDDLASALGDDRVLCEEPPFSLSANAPRPLMGYLWSDGSTGEVLEVNSSGTYWLEATDGYCELRDTVELTFWQDLLTQGPALSLPADTIYCEQHLPYLLLPQSAYVQLPVQELWEAGEYEVSTELFGCPVRDSFALELSDCRAHIYFPNAFSPNGDGINDLFLPQGKDYRGIELQIYDRWGGLLFATREEPFVWDGRSAPFSSAQGAAAGVYVYVFRYVNLLSGEEEVMSGEVVVVKS